LVGVSVVGANVSRSKPVVALIAARDTAPEFDRAHLFENPLPADWLARCNAVGAIALDANWRTLTKEIVAEVHANGLRVACSPAKTRPTQSDSGSGVWTA